MAQARELAESGAVRARLERILDPRLLAFADGGWAGLLHAALLSAAFAPFNLWFLAPFAVVPLLFISRRRPGRLFSMALGVWVGASVFWDWQMLWVWEVSPVGFLPLVAYLSLFPTLFVVLMARLRRRRPGVPVAGAAAVLWVGIEYLRGELLFDGYAWYFVAHPLINLAPALGASVLGAYGVGLAVLAPTLAIIELARSPFNKLCRLQAAACLLLLALALAMGGLARLGPDDETQQVRLALVQTNIPQDNRSAWSHDSRVQTLILLEEKTREAASQGAQIVVWPETMFPGYFLDEATARSIARNDRLHEEFRFFVETVRQRVLDLSGETGVSIVVGATAYENFVFEDIGGELRDRFDRSFNSAFLVEGGRLTDQRYDKLHLTPFGEAMPYIEKWPALQQRLLALGARGMSFDLSRGDAPKVLQPSTTGVSLATPICFEITVAKVCRRLVREAPGPVVLVNMTNDGWFGRSDRGREAHLLAARWRAAELGVPVLRAANTGISAAIDAGGRIADRLDTRAPGLLVADVVAAAPRSAQMTVGELPGIAALIGGVLVMVLGFGRRPNGQRPAPPPADTPPDGTREPSTGEERTA
ncbi:MAG: apolipoprotein N-acyltransferase [Phycisphaerales bacterium]|nr:apolipoprotein N-acyltransferase [Phycisphaerales bacterium]